MPEVHALVAFLAERTVGHAISRATITSFSALKTFAPPIDALDGARITGVTRHGKFIDIETEAAHLVFHLARAGWLRWFDAVPATAIKPGRSPIALRVRLDGRQLLLRRLMRIIHGLLRQRPMLIG